MAFFPSELMSLFFAGFAVYSIGPPIYRIHHLCIYIDEGRDKPKITKKRRGEEQDGYC
jgi:hypothetical protein